MADIENEDQFLEGRWKWTAGGYEDGFPRRCQFTDIDAAIEFDGHALIMECKHHDGKDGFTYPKAGQLRFLRDEVKRGKSVLVVYGVARSNSPWGVWRIGPARKDDVLRDWRGEDLDLRRKLLKAEIDWALGLA
jgi:hypothetical protein